MADITASTAFRDFISTYLSTAGSCFMWATLHSSKANITAASTYAGTGLDELGTANGYTAGGKTCGTITEADGVLDTPDVVWTTSEGETLTAACGCIWINNTNNIDGAALVGLEDNTQTAGGGGPMSFHLTNPITIPTSA